MRKGNVMMDKKDIQSSKIFVNELGDPIVILSPRKDLKEEKKKEKEISSKATVNKKEDFESRVF